MAIDRLPDNDEKKQKLKGVRLCWRAGLSRRGGPMPGDDQEIFWTKRILEQRSL